MTSLNEAIERRRVGHLRIAIVGVRPNDDLTSTLARLGLEYQGETCREVDAAVASTVQLRGTSRCGRDSRCHHE
jgi:hypothetical protein